MKYYLVAYYARLKGNGFGFSRCYWATNKEFSLLQFESQVSNESGLKSNDICVISRTLVSVEEYNQNIEEAEKKAIDDQVVE